MVRSLCSISCVAYVFLVFSAKPRHHRCCRIAAALHVSAVASKPKANAACLDVWLFKETLVIFNAART